MTTKYRLKRGKPITAKPLRGLEICAIEFYYQPLGEWQLKSTHYSLRAAKLRLKELQGIL